MESKRGKTIQIYLWQGNPRGIKICEITSGIVKGILIPRSELKEAVEIKELNKTGIYFLFSEKDILSKFETYIGEAETLIRRISQHDAHNDKIDWNYVICFTSSKDNLNKAHAKFLENYCYKLANEINNSKIINSVEPTKSNLTRPEEDFVLDFFEEMNILLSTLGYPLFERLTKVVNKKEVFYCKETNAYATGNLVSGGFVVYSGSKAKVKVASSAGNWVETIRDNLIEQGIRAQVGDVMIFKKDFIFSSPSTAATAVLARRANGWIEWKNTKDNKTLDELERKKIK